MSSISVFIDAYNNSIPDWLNLGCNNLTCNNLSFNSAVTTFNTTFTCQGGAPSVSYPISMAIIGDMVQMTFGYLSMVASNVGNTIVSTTPIPTPFRPANNVNVGFCYYGQTIGGPPNYPGAVVQIGANGIITMTALNGGPFPNTATITPEGTSFSWIYNV